MKKISLTIQTFLTVGIIMVLCGNVWSSSNTKTYEYSSGIVIDLKSNSFVRGRNITVGDIATVTGADIDLSLTIDSIVLARAPWPGNDTTIGLGEIMTMLNNRGVDLNEVSFEGASEVTVNVESIVISGREIAAHAEKYLRNKLAHGDDYLVLELQLVPHDQVVPLGNGDVKLKFTRISSGRSKKHIYLSISIMVDGDVFRTVGLTFNVQRFGSVVVAKRVIKSGQVIRKRAVSIESVETTRLINTTFDNVESVIGKIAKRSFRPGQVITEEMLKNVAVMRKGDTVVILIKSRGFSIRSKGICKEDGTYGDMVKVVNIDTKKVLYGNVLDRGTVEVQG
ncbi:MAG: flagellar basal body P-ring formation chaperone FlgA [Candidatus Anammoxibacter sp.]